MIELEAELENSENFGDIFDLVRKAVKGQLGMERAGLMLVLADLPLHLGAYHGVGSNSIVMNRALLDRVVASGKPRSHINSFVFSILLHEYLHSLGVVEETEVRRLVHEITFNTFGPDHPASQIAAKGPWSLLGHPGYVDTAIPRDSMPEKESRQPELITDFDRSHKSYIS